MKSLCFLTRTPSMATPFSGGSVSISARALTLSEMAMEKVIESAESIIMKWDAETSAYAGVTSLFYEDKREAAQFIQRVNDLQLAMQSLVLENSVSEKLIRAHRLMERAMKRLQKELYQMLSMNRAHLDPESVSARSSRTSVSTRSTVSDFDEEEVDDGGVEGELITEVEEASSMVMSELKAISECMISCGYGKEYISIYNIIRKSIIDEGIYRLGVEKTTQSQIQKMDWEVVDVRIKNWLQAVKVAMNTLFRGERILSDHVFSSSDSIRESCFSDISREGAGLLFGFPEMVVKNRKSSPEKIFRLLDMYTVISEHWNEIEVIFAFDSTFAIRSQALNSLVRLSESIRTLVTDFEATIQKDASKTVPPGGGVHKLTVTSMNYLCLLTDYSSILGDIFGDWTTSAKSPLSESFFESPARNDAPASAISVHMAWLILILFCKLDGKAKHYKDVSRAYLFLANNLQHIVSRVRASNLQYLLGEDWIVKNEEKITQFAANYERIGWGIVIASSTVVPPDFSNASASFSLAEAKECFRRFNSSFEEAYQKHSTSVVVDPDLRERITTSIKTTIVGSYREMYETQKMAVEEMRNAAMFVKYSPEDVEECLSQLFIGSINLRSCSSISSLSSSRRR